MIWFLWYLGSVTTAIIVSVRSSDEDMDEFGWPLRTWLAAMLWPGYWGIKMLSAPGQNLLPPGEGS